MCAFSFNDTATTEIYTLSLHDALPIWRGRRRCTRAASAAPRRARLRAPASPGGPRPPTGRAPTRAAVWDRGAPAPRRTDAPRSEEHTSELQSHSDLVCRLLLEKKKKHK